MASKSPGKKKEDEDEEAPTGSLSRAASKLGSLFGSGRRKGRKKSKNDEEKASGSARLEVAYYGHRTDARDRSSEDPRRHVIPRASLSSSPVPKGDHDISSEEENSKGEKQKMRKKSIEREKGRRVSRERELEREKRLRERSRSRERLGHLTSTEQAKVNLTSSTQDLLQKQLFESAAHISSTTVTAFKSSSPSPLSRSKSSVGASTNVTSLTQSAKDSSFVKRQTSFRVERNFELSRHGKMPPVPPPRLNKSKVSSSSPTPPPQVTEMSFEVKRDSTSKTPYQFWREQRQSVHEKEADKSITSPEPEKADEILTRWKLERAKRVRNLSGNSAVSNASSSTAEPLKKKVLPTSHPKPQFVSIKSDNSLLDKEKSKNGGDPKDRKSSLSAMFQSLTKRKSSKEPKDEERKYSIKSLMKTTALDPEFHEAVLHPVEDKGEPEPVLGTVLHPVLPKGTQSRTPFEEWRHYRETKKVSAPPILSHSPITAPTLAVRAKTPDPDYDSVSVASTSSRSSAGRMAHLHESSHEDIHRLVGPQYYNPSQRSYSAMGIPRFVHRPRGPSIVSASPRLERPLNYQSSNESFFSKSVLSGGRLASAQSHQWYQEYSHDAFPHEAEFGEETKIGNFDGRIHSIKGKKTS